MDHNTLYGLANYIDELSDHTDKRVFHVDWMGGEPLLMGMEFYEEAMSIIGSRRDVRFFFRTNMTLIDDEWIDFIKHNNIHVGGSLDGPKDLHDSQRSGSFNDAYRGLLLLKDAEVLSDVACTMTQETMKRLDEVFEFFYKLDLHSWIMNTEICAVSPIQTAFNFQRLYHLWNSHDQPHMFPRFGEVQRRITYLMDGGATGDCSTGGCGQGWTIISPTGGCHLCNHENCTTITEFGNVNENHPRDIWNSESRIQYLDDVRKARSNQCGACAHRFICRGNCYHHINRLGGAYDPYCSFGYHTYEVIIESLGYTMDEYREAVQQLEAKQGGIA
jgi:uncharacterized protein